MNAGKMICTGAKLEMEAKQAIRKVARDLKEANIIITGEPEATIGNIVASGRFEWTPKSFMGSQSLCEMLVMTVSRVQA